MSIKYELYTYRKEYNENSVTAEVTKFDSKDALFAYVRKYDYTCADSGTRANRFIEAVMTGPRDSLRNRLYRYAYSVNARTKVYTALGYLVKDENGKTIDLRNYADEVFAFDLAKHYKELNRKRDEEFEEWLKARKNLWDIKDKLYEGKFYWSYYRRFRTTQERRYSRSDEHKPYIRGRRSFRSLPNAWDDIGHDREKTWKARTKVKRQWLVNKALHVDTVKSYSPRTVLLDGVPDLVDDEFD